MTDFDDEHAQMIANSIFQAFRIAGSQTVSTKKFLTSIRGNALAYDIFSILPEDSEISMPMVNYLLDASGHADVHSHIEQEQHDFELLKASLALRRERGL